MTKTSLCDHFDGARFFNPTLPKDFVHSRRSTLRMLCAPRSQWPAGIPQSEFVTLHEGETRIYRDVDHLQPRGYGGAADSRFKPVEHARKRAERSRRPACRTWRPIPILPAFVGRKTDELGVARQDWGCNSVGALIRIQCGAALLIEYYSNS